MMALLLYYVSERAKSNVSLDADATELLVRCCGGRADTLFVSISARLRSYRADQEDSNRPHLTRREVADALERLRIRIPSEKPVSTALDIHTLSGQEFESVIRRSYWRWGSRQS